MQRGNVRGGPAVQKEKRDQKNDRRKREKRRITPGAVAALVLLLILPGMAVFRLCPPLDIRWVLGYWLVISAVTYALYFRDKRKAEAGEWRIPESTLHLAELIGGWPAAFFAQREFRHKISKQSYQTTFWMIVTLYQAVAGDFLLRWSITRNVWALIQRLAA